MDHYHELAQQFLRDMVAFPTVNGNEKPLAQYIAGVLEGYGFRTQLQDIAENRSNVVAVYGSSDNRIIFTGHLDVVPPGGDWQVCRSLSFDRAERSFVWPGFLRHEGRHCRYDGQCHPGCGNGRSP